MSLKEALSSTKGWRGVKCIFESNPKLLVDALNGHKGNSYFGTIITDCIELLKYFDEVLVVFAYRSVNNVTHLLVRTVCSMSSLRSGSAPKFIEYNITSEKY